MASSVPSSYRTPLRCGLRSLFTIAVLGVIIQLVPTARSSAQVYREWRDTSLVPEKRPYNTGQTEFTIGTYHYNYSHDRPVVEIWPAMDSLRMDYLIFKVEQGGTLWNRYDSLLRSPLRPPAGRVIPMPTYAGSRLAQVGRAQEVTFYPFDSSEMRSMVNAAYFDYHHVFTQFDDDVTAINTSSANLLSDGAGPRESIYFPADSGTVVASDIAYNKDTVEVYRYPKYYTGSSWADRPYGTVMDVALLLNEKKQPGNLYNVVVKGHLFYPLGTLAVDSDSLLRINVWYEIAKGDTYYDSTNTQRTADTNLRFHYTSLWVTKLDLKKPSPSDDDGLYLQKLLPLDLAQCATCGMRGPLGTGNTSKRFDLEVIYLGKEKLALRSVGLRDSLTQLLMGTSPAAQDYRDSIMKEIDTLVKDPSTGLVRAAVHSLYSDGEFGHTQYAGFREIDKMAKENYDLSGDSLALWAEWGDPYIHHLGNSDHVIAEYYFNKGVTPIEETDYVGLFGIDHQQTPSIAQHNGGRWRIPLLFDLDSVGMAGHSTAQLRTRIESYEQTIQQQFFGRYGGLGPGQGWPYNATHIPRMGLIAENARQHGRRITSILGPVSWLKVWMPGAVIKAADTGDVVAVDTLISLSHRYERAELRALGAITLAYGTKNWTYYEQTTWPWIGAQTDGSGDTVGLEACCLGFGGEHVNDTNLTKNFFDWAYRYPGGAQDTALLMEGMYLGLRSTMAELKEMNGWAKRIGSTLARLRWRNTYSVHWQARRPGKDLGDTPRPVPSNEIIGGVTARHPITGTVDANYRTYVELGLFETVIDTVGGRNRWNDTNYMFLVNRRTFETGNYDQTDIGYSNGVKAVLDTLSETRVLSFGFQMIDTNLGDDQYQYIRVRQVEPDTAHIPLIGRPHVLDTIVGADQYVEVTLGAGRGTLLEITRMRPDESITSGLLTRNNQRKIVYDALTKSYYATYHRYDTAAGDWHVYFQKSLPVDTTGSVRWEPLEWAVSKSMKFGDAPRTTNSHPSITFRHIGAKSRISIVWTAHPNAIGHPNEREVLMRDLEYQKIAVGLGGDSAYQLSTYSNINAVAYHHGVNAEVWGTPVLSAVNTTTSSDLSEYIAWSDSVVGITARGRLYNASVNPAPQYTPIDTVNTLIMSAWSSGRPGRYPALPPFAHRGMPRASVGLAWQQPGAVSTYDGIAYGRLNYTPPVVGPKISLSYLATSDVWISPNHFWGGGTTIPQHYLHPSIDQSQDGLGRIMEGVSFEHNYYDTIWSGGSILRFDYKTDVYFRSIRYDTSTQQASLIGSWLNYADVSPGVNPGYGYPVTSSQNQVMVPADSSSQSLFSVVYAVPPDTDPMHILTAKWLPSSTAQWVLPAHIDYLFGGYNPNGTASDVKLTNRHSTLYVRPSDSTLKATRQYFARVRPGGYQADGIEVGAPLNDSLGIGFSARLFDVWASDDQRSVDLDIPSHAAPDSLGGMTSLVRTTCFTTSDSVDIGATVQAKMFVIDTADASGRMIDVITELVDSTSGAVIHQLDSTRLSSVTTSRSIEIATTLDLLSGTYFIRTRISSPDLDPSLALDSTVAWSTGVLSAWVPSQLAKRVERLDGEAGNGLRLSAQPNPFAEETEIRFSIPHGEQVSLRVFDASGREVTTLIDGEEMEQGRYAAALESANLPNGAYIVELRAGEERISTHVVLQR